ncbi:MAG TPA: MBL fold metallo-hydrolase [Bryobacteraceae bacterium]|nr:MBL fold metallo-hydrolase [Bryobacteraceae bacterium]
MLKKSWLQKSMLVTTSALALVIGATATVTALEAQDKQGKGKGVRDMTQHTSQVKPGLYFIQGAGGNSLLRVTPDGLILMDGKLPGNYEPLMDQIKAVSNQPIKYLINTHHHEDHTGNNAKFLAAGVQIVATEELKNQLQHYNPPGGKPADPTITYKGTEYTLKLGGAEVDLYHFGRAHTGGDSVVYFPDLKVVALSDVIGPGAPGADFPGGGSLVEWGPVLASTLKLDWDVCIPGTGDALKRADVETYKTKVDTLVSRAKELVKNGTPKDQLMAQLKTDDLGWRLNLTGDRLDMFYDELSKSK